MPVDSSREYIEYGHKNVDCQADPNAHKAYNYAKLVHNRAEQEPPQSPPHRLRIQSMVNQPPIVRSISSDECQSQSGHGETRSVNNDWHSSRAIGAQQRSGKGNEAGTEQEQIVEPE